MLNNKVFCIRPWTQGCVRTNGDITLCCVSDDKSGFNLKTSTINDWWNSNFLVNIREQMMSGQQPDTCALCYNDEEQGKFSHRQKSNKEYKIFDRYIEKILAYYQYPTLSPIEIEFQLTNLCNLKCLMCNEDSSSSIFSENKILKINKININDYIVSSDEIIKIQEWMKTKPKRINFRGGEPMIVPEIKQLLKWGIENNLLDKTEIHITTNGTKLDAEWEDILSKIAKKRIMVSIDGLDKINEYIRYGSNWSVIVDNLRKLSSIPNVTLIIHAVVQNLNILSISQLINWCNDNGYYIEHSVVMHPAIFKLNNLPKGLLDQAKENLLNPTNSNRITQEILQTLNKIDDSGPDLWNEFKEEINLRDKIRKISITNLIPEFKEYW